MKKTIIILLSSIIYCTESNNTNLIWDVLQDNDVWIGVSQYDMKIETAKCKAEIIIDATFPQILDVIEDIENYKIFFDSIIISDINDKDEVRLAIDMPLFFSSRDFTIVFNKIVSDSNVKFLYRPVNSLSYPVDDKYIRLVEANGGWYLDKVDSYNTKVSYIWKGDLLGNFPKRLYPTSWTKQGNEIMNNLIDEVNKRKNNK